MAEVRAPAAIPALAVGCALALGGCTTYGTALAEFDSVSGLQGTEAWPDEVAYRHDPERYPWLARQLDGIGAGWLLREVFEVEPRPTEVDNPSGFARERLAILSDRSTGDLLRSAITGRRLSWIAEFDEDQPMNQAVAVLGMERLMAALGFDPLATQLPDPTVMTKEKVDAWVAILNRGWPGTRTGPLGGEARAEYVDALQQLTALPLVSGARQRALIGALDRGLELERDPELLEPSRAALQRALHHGLAMGLRRALSARAPRVREAAIGALHRLAGADAVAWILDQIAKPSTSAARGINRYDEDPFVRLTLVRMCGQLDTERALGTVGSGPAPAEFLYETFFGDPEEGLRTVALEALAHCLGRDVDFDPEWAERWWRDDYVPNRGVRTPR